MCGIAGFWRQANSSEVVLKNTVERMTNALHFRGPDGCGLWVDPAVGLALGHRRLKIVDLSDAGHQPMVSNCGRYIIIFNGEIYNHLELRSKLPNHFWRGHSDTETLLAAIVAWGVESALQQCVGMFAIALWDLRERNLYLVRDRFGEKPLYYGWIGKGDEQAFVFASELKGLKAYPGFSNLVCRDALAQYIRFKFVPAPLTIYQQIYKLEPGNLLVLPLSPKSGGQFEIRQYWSFEKMILTARLSPVVDEVMALEELEALLNKSVKLQSLAEVPLGAFLSGGIDSSMIVALMQAQSSRPIKTFTIGFDVEGYDESVYAKNVAHHLGTCHTELFVSSDEVLNVIPRIHTIYDEPFADSSQIPTYLISQLARKDVTVALSGDGGDELFGGYNRYFWGVRIWGLLNQIPFSLRQKIARAIELAPLKNLNKIFNLIGVNHLDSKALKLSELLNTSHTSEDVYLSLVSEWAEPHKLVKGVGESNLLQNPFSVTRNFNFAERMMYADTLRYLPDDILCKVDRAAMSVSLETRMPFLDHRVAEFAWRLPFNMKIRGNKSKWALRQILYKYVPPELIERPKAGFAVPIGDWLRGPLRDWAENLLSESRLHNDGYFHPEQIRHTWQQHLSGYHDYSARIWTILMFQSWLEGEE